MEESSKQGLPFLPSELHSVAGGDVQVKMLVPVLSPDCPPLTASPAPPGHALILLLPVSKLAFFSSVLHDQVQIPPFPPCFLTR